VPLSLTNINRFSIFSLLAKNENEETMHLGNKFVTAAISTHTQAVRHRANVSSQSVDMHFIVSSTHPRCSSKYCNNITTFNIFDVELPISTMNDAAEKAAKIFGNYGTRTL